MERTASRPPPGGGANWAVFFAPLGVTGVVILGALVFVWTSEPEPVDRPEVERVDLSERDPVPEVPRLSSVPTIKQFEGAAEGDVVHPVRAPGAERVVAAPSSDEAPAAQVEDEYEDDEEDKPEGTPDERTPEEIAAAKARAKEYYFGGRSPYSKALNMSLAKTQESGTDETVAVTQTASSNEGEGTVPEESPRQLGGASGQN